MLKRSIVRVGLLAALLAGCSPDYVIITLSIPKGVGYRGLRVSKSVENSSAAPTVVVKDLPPRDDHTVRLIRPDSGTTVLVLVQAYGDGSPTDRKVVAEGETEVKWTARDAHIDLETCENLPALGDPRGHCHPPPPPPPLPDRDAGAPEAGADGAGPGADGGVGNAAGLVCHPDGGAVLPVVAPPNSTPECRAYCTAVTKSCVNLYVDQDHCLFACDRYGWSADEVRCRTNWAVSAADDLDSIDKESTCRQASLDSGRACNLEPCEIYCQAGPRICPDHFPEDSVCATACRGWVKARAARVDAGPVVFEQHVRCRTQMLEEALFDPAFCDRAAPYTDCGSPCVVLDFDRP
jgi:hypothetical protein